MSNVAMPEPAVEPTQGLYRIHFDQDAQIIRVVLQGFWNEQDVERYSSCLGKFFEASRRRFGSARALIDRRHCPVQTAEVNNKFLGLNSLARSDDWLAIVTDSGLAQMQIKRSLVHSGSEVFRDMQKAEAWLASCG